jgi:hypothetical protein
MGKNKRVASPSKKKIKEQRITPPSMTAKPTHAPLEAQQEALVKRGYKTFTKEGGVIIESEPGLGKSRKAGALLSKIGKKVVKDGSKMLGLFVAIDATQAQELQGEVGALGSPPFQPSDKKAVKMVEDELADTGHATVDITRDMMRKLLGGDPTKKTAKPAEMPELANKLGLSDGDMIVVVLDEVHDWYDKPSAWPAAFKKTREAMPSIPIGVIGLSAKTGLDVKRRRDGARTLIGIQDDADVLNLLVDYTDEECAALKATLKKQPEVPTEFDIYQMDSPVDDPKCKALLSELHIAIVNMIVTDDDDKIRMQRIVADTVAKITATQAHGDNGDLILEQLDEEGFPMCGIDANGELTGQYTDRKESVVLAYKSRNGAEMGLSLLQTLEAANKEAIDNGGEPLSSFDIKVHSLFNTKSATAKKKKIKEFLDCFKAQMHTAVAVIDKDLSQGQNFFAKNVTTIIAIGDWDGDELFQLAGRLGRIVQLKEGDLVPRVFKTVHMKSEWAEKVSSIESNKRSRTAQIPSNVAAMLDSLKPRHKHQVKEMATKAKQLIAADEFLKTDGALALQYLKLFAPKDAEEGEEDGEEGEEEDEGEDEMEDDEEGDEED